MISVKADWAETTVGDFYIKHTICIKLDFAVLHDSSRQKKINTAIFWLWSLLHVPHFKNFPIIIIFLRIDVSSVC